MLIRLVLTLLLAAAGPLAAEPAPGTLCSSGTHGPRLCIRPDHFTYDTCRAIETFADESGLDAGFFARLVWQESRFDPNALSPANARGIAQFIDSTAALRGLEDSYNPALALEFSAAYLGEMTRRYGNQGLAAVGYNGGERRAEGLIAGTGGLARETIDYVRIITGLSAETWRDDPPDTHDFRLQGDMPFQEACRDMAENRRLTSLTPPEPERAPWGAQVSFSSSRGRAEAKMGALPAACRRALADAQIDYVRERSRASPTGSYFFARAGAETRDGAWAICRRVRAGGCPCLVQRNR